MPIVFDLECRSAQHRFEGWFKSSEDYARQLERGLVACPHCGSADVCKAVQAPRLGLKGNQRAEPARAGTPVPAVRRAEDAPAAPVELPPQAVEVLQKLAVMQAEALKTSRFVGDSFVDDARAMHYGERDSESIHGRASVQQAKELIEEGIAVAALPFPVLPPEQAN